MRRRIAVVTGSRAEYGLLRWLMEHIANDPRLELQVVVTGMHLSSAFGLTYGAIEQDGFTIAEKVEMPLSGDDPREITKSVGIATAGFADAYARLSPALVVVLGDRFEILAAAQAALLMRVPIAHLHGGERSDGAIDDSIRHALTKMAALHFVAAEEYRRRVVQMGEHPSRVFSFGAPGLDGMQKIARLELPELERSLGVALTKPTFLVTYHPATLGDADAVEAVGAMCRALDRFPDARVVVTKPNADAGGRAIAAALDAWAATRTTRVVVHTSLGHQRYLSTLAHAAVVVGNSSSGLIEAPAMRVPTVNVGPRQDGRLKAASVIDCAESEEAIVAAIERALSPAHASVVREMSPPYGTGANASERIKDVLASVKLDGLVKKQFVDLAYEDPLARGNPLEEGHARAD